MTHLLSLTLICCICKCLLSLPLEASTKIPDFICEFQDDHYCGQENADKVKCSTGLEVCEAKQSEDKRQHCYAFFSNISGVVTDRKKGCWLNFVECYDKMECVTKDYEEGKYFCCCDGSMCNQKVTISNEKYVKITAKTTVKPFSTVQQRHTIATILCVSLLPLICVAIFTILAFLAYHRFCPNGLNRHCFMIFKSEGHRKALLSSALPGTMTSSLTDSKSNSIADGLQLMEVKAFRQYGGCVKRGKLGDKMVAVKIFTIQEKSSWVKETDFYRLSYMKHENILTFVASMERKYNALSSSNMSSQEFWLITEYQERGSLHDLLKSTCLTWNEALKIATTACRGIAFLHNKLAGADNWGTVSKPEIAHRDIKSRNILIKSDMSACIADFGLALALEGNMGEAHCQVGTPRYMSPEVLEASIDCSLDNFLKIDVYAFGLVLWEIVSRCSDTSGVAIDYKLPFETELGQHPSLEDMQKAVVINRIRPIIKAQWKQHKAINVLCLSMEELWDQDPEARNSMLCICERLEALVGLV